MRVRRCVRCRSTFDLQERVDSVDRTPSDAGDIAFMINPMLGSLVRLAKTRFDHVVRLECVSCMRYRKRVRWLWVVPVLAPLVIAVVTSGDPFLTMAGSLAAVLVVAGIVTQARYGWSSIH